MSFSINRDGITVTGDKMSDVFKELADLQEVFAIAQCGKCKCEDLQYVVRKDNDDNEYYELRCKNLKCRAKLSFGQHKKGGGLFPRRKDKDDKWLPDGGWVRWDKEAGKEV